MFVFLPRDAIASGALLLRHKLWGSQQKLDILKTAYSLGIQVTQTGSPNFLRCIWRKCLMSCFLDSPWQNMSKQSLRWHASWTILQARWLHMFFVTQVHPMIFSTVAGTFIQSRREDDGWQNRRWDVMRNPAFSSNDGRWWLRQENKLLPHHLRCFHPCSSLLWITATGFNQHTMWTLQFGMLGFIFHQADLWSEAATFRDVRNHPSRHWHHTTLPESSKRKADESAVWMGRFTDRWALWVVVYILIIFTFKFTYTQNFSANLTLMRIQKESAKSVPFFCRPLLNYNCWIFIRLTPEGVEGCIVASNEAVHAAGILAFGWLLHCTLHTTTNRSLWNNSFVTCDTESRKVMGKFGDFTFKFCCMAWMVWTIHTQSEADQQVGSQSFVQSSFPCTIGTITFTHERKVFWCQNPSLHLIHDKHRQTLEQAKSCVHLTKFMYSPKNDNWPSQAAVARLEYPFWAPGCIIPFDRQVFVICKAMSFI